MTYSKCEGEKTKQTNKPKPLTKIPYPARLSFRIEGEIKSFPDMQKLKEFITTKPVLEKKC